MCNAEIKKMETEAAKDIEPLEAEQKYNDCRIKELNKEWEQVRDEFRTGNEYLKPQFLQLKQKTNKTSDDPTSVALGDNLAMSEVVQTQTPPPYGDPVDDYYYSDTGPVEDPECVCFLDDQCKCVPHCRNLFNSCAARYKSTRNSLYQRWKNAKKRVAYQRNRIHSLEENIRRTRAADPEKDTDGYVEDKYRVSRCGGKPHVVR